MLTPQEVEKKVFVKAVFGGYEMAGVDDFIESVAEDYSALYKENAILKGKIKVLVEKVEEYRSTEDVMRMTLLAAQKTGNEIIEEAKVKSESTLSELENLAKTRRQEVEESLRNEGDKLSLAKSATAEFISAVRSVVGKHVEFLDRLETLTPSAAEEAPPQAEPEPQIPESKIVDIAAGISAAISESVSETFAAAENEVPFSPGQEDIDSTKRFDFVKVPSDDDGDNPRPKFNFDNLKFGLNYNDKD